MEWNGGMLYIPGFPNAYINFVSFSYPVQARPAGVK